jgi:hypothetical protein
MLASALTPSAPMEKQSSALPLTLRDHYQSGKLNEMIDKLKIQEPETFEENANAEDDGDKVQIIGGDERETVVLNVQKMLGMM